MASKNSSAKIVVSTELLERAWAEAGESDHARTRVAHGRSPFTGPRKIVLAMGGLVRLSDVEIVTSR